MFDILHLMAASLSASLSALFWSVLLLFGIMMSAALVMVSAVQFYIVDETNPNDKRMIAYGYFGNFTKAFLSVFELTLGNFTPIMRFLCDTISEVYGHIFMMYYCLVSFAIIMVIRGIFLHETFQAADSNDNLMILKQMRTRNEILRKFERLFFEADVSGDGFVSHEEFTLIMKDERVQTWLAAMGLDVPDANIIFEMVDSGENHIDLQSFVSGLARLKGQARAVDLMQVLRYSRSLMDLLVGVQGKLVSADAKPLLLSDNEHKLVSAHAKPLLSSDNEHTRLDSDFSVSSIHELCEDGWRALAEIHAHTHGGALQPTLLTSQSGAGGDKHDANSDCASSVSCCV